MHSAVRVVEAPLPQLHPLRKVRNLVLQGPPNLTIDRTVFKKWLSLAGKGNQRISPIGQPEDRTGAAPLEATPMMPQPQED